MVLRLRTMPLSAGPVCRVPTRRIVFPARSARAEEDSRSMSSSIRRATRFSPSELGRALRAAESRRRPSVLFVGDGASERIVEIRPGQIRVLARGARTLPDLASHLLSRQLLDVESLERAMHLARADGQSLENVLVRQDLLSQEQLARVLFERANEALFDLAFFTDADLIASESPDPETTSALRALPGVSCDLLELAAELDQWAERWSRWRSLFHSDRSRIALRESELAAIESYEGPCEEWIDLCRDPATLRDLWLASRWSLSPFLEGLVELSSLGWLNVTPPPKDQRSLSERVAELEANRECFLGSEIVRERLANLYLQSNRAERAAEEWIDLARADVARGDHELAAARATRVIELRPENLEALEIAVRAWIARGETRRAVALAGAHARRLIAIGRADDALAVSRKLHGVAGGESESSQIEAEAIRSGARATGGSSRRFIANPWIEGGGASLSPPYDESKVVRRASSLVASFEASEIAPPPRDHFPVRENESFRAPLRSVEAPRPRAVARVALLGSLAVAFGAVLVLTCAWVFLPRHSRAAADSGENAVAVGTTVGPVDEAWPSVPHDDRPRRVLDEDLVAHFSEGGDCEIRERWSDDVLLTLEGAPEARWAIGHRGHLIARWQPGAAPVLWAPRSANPEPVRLGWVLPSDTAAVAVDARAIAVRRGAHTILYGHDGKPREGGSLRLWTEGVFVGATLLLQRPASSPEETSTLWAAETQPLRVLWIGEIHDGVASIR